jgi:hypothetical protein
LKLRVAEIKATRATQNARWTFGKTVSENIQMTDGWIEQVWNSLNPGEGRELLRRIIDKSPGLKTDKIGIFVDGSGNTNLLRLN